jgi:hypothetical protein
MIHRRLTADFTIAAPQHRQAERWIGSSLTSRCRDRGVWRPSAQSPDRDAGRDTNVCTMRPFSAALPKDRLVFIAREVFCSVSAAGGVTLKRGHDAVFM